MAKAKKKEALSLEEKLEQALVSVDEQPYEVPENWCWVYSLSLFDIEYGKGLPTKNLTEDGYPVFGANGQIGYFSEYMYEEEKALMSCRGAYSGTMNQSLPKAYVTSNSLIIEDKGKVMMPKYICYMYEALDTSKLVSGSAQPQVTVQAFKKYPVPLPPLTEQQRIVEQIESLFAKLDEAKDITEKAISTFELRRSALLYKAFNGELTDEWRKNQSCETASDYLERMAKEEEHTLRGSLKYWNNSKLPEGWCESKIGDLLYYAGRIGWKGLKAEEYTEEGPLLLSVYNLNDGDEVSYHRVYHITEERYEESPEIMVQVGDVLLTKDGAGIGKLGYVKELPERATINSSLLLIRPGKLAESKYIYYLLSGPSLQRIVKERITGSATPHLFQRDIKEFVIPIPPIEEQRQIVKVLDDMLLKETQAYEELKLVSENIDLMKKSVLAKAFRGELGTNNPDEESAVELLKSILVTE